MPSMTLGMAMLASVPYTAWAEDALEDRSTDGITPVDHTVLSTANVASLRSISRSNSGSGHGSHFSEESWASKMVRDRWRNSVFVVWKRGEEASDSGSLCESQRWRELCQSKASGQNLHVRMNHVIVFERSSVQYVKKCEKNWGLMSCSLCL